MSSAVRTCSSGFRRAACSRQSMVGKMAARPLILALANPTPEILPEEVRAVRDDAVIATGRSDYPESGQQRPVLSLHLSRRVGCRRDHHHPADGNRRRARHRRAGAPGAKRHRRRRLRRHRGSGVRPGLSHPQALRPAPDRQDRAGGRQGRHGVRRGHPADRRPRSLRPATAAIRLSQRHADAADLRRRARGGARIAAASSTPKARTSACCAPCRSSWTKSSRRPFSSAARR